MKQKLSFCVFFLTMSYMQVSFSADDYLRYSFDPHIRRQIEQLLNRSDSKIFTESDLDGILKPQNLRILVLTKLAKEDIKRLHMYQTTEQADQ